MVQRPSKLGLGFAVATFAVTACLASNALAAFPAASQATTGVNDYHDRGDPSGYSGRALIIISDQAANDYRVDIEDGTITIRDLSGQGFQSSLPECSATAANELSCAPSEAFSDRGVVLMALLLDDEDRFSPGLGEPGCGREPLALTSETDLATGVQLWGSAYADSIGFTSAPRGNVYGCGGPDHFSVAGHDAHIWGGRGGDHLKVTSRHAVAFGQRGPDRLIDGGGPNKLVGGLGRDHLRSGFGHDILLGGPGDDYLKAFQSDFLNCGPGLDRAQARQNSRLRDCERKS
jgi:hypothetical protein